MTTVITVSDPEMIAKLKKAEHRVEFTTSDGEPVKVMRVENPTVLPPGVESPYSIDEIEERRKNFDGRPLADFIRELEARG